MASAALFAATLVVAASEVRAAVYTWDADGTTPSTIVDGNGNWNKVAGNTVWVLGGSNAVWADDNDAVFGNVGGAVNASPYLVTIPAANTFVRAANITFNKNYTVSDSNATQRLILTGGITANESATINSNRASVLQAAQGSNVNWTVALGKTLTFNSVNAGNSYLVGGNAAGIGATKALTLNGAGTTTFTALTSEVGFSVPNLSILNVTSGTMNISSARASDGLALLIRGGAGAGAGNAGGTLNLTGGLLDTGTGQTNIQTASTFAGIANLNGGIFATGKVTGTTTSLGNGGALTFNGGTLRANIGNVAMGTFTSTAFMPSTTAGGLTTTLVSTGGGTIDSQAFTINVDQVLAHDAAGAATDGGITKIGGGTLNLTAVNTYTGNTNANAGTLNLADNAGLFFKIGANNVNNKIQGGGTVQLDGDFTFDLTGAAAADGSLWTIVANAARTFGGSFSVVGFTDNLNDTWSRSANGTTYTFSELTGQLMTPAAAVPEPTTLAVIGLAAGTLLGRRRRRA